jgi:hypothetical protein
MEQTFQFTSKEDDASAKYVTNLLNLLPIFPPFQTVQQQLKKDAESQPFENNASFNLFAMDTQGFLFIWNEEQRTLDALNLKKLKITETSIQVRDCIGDSVTNSKPLMMKITLEIAYNGFIVIRLYWRFNGFFVVASAVGTTKKPLNLQYNLIDVFSDNYSICTAVSTLQFAS